MVHSITYINYTKKDVINQGEKSLEINLDFFCNAKLANYQTCIAFAAYHTYIGIVK